MASGESSSSRFNPFKSTKPPPPPPKDYVYGRPPLTPGAGPSSPLSPVPPLHGQFTFKRANSPLTEESYPAGSSYNFTSSTPSLLSPPGPRSGDNMSVHTVSKGPSKKDKALGFLKFPKKSPRTPPAFSTSSGDSRSGTPTGVIVISGSGGEEEDPPPPKEDDGISMPWNFQHNIHVDEGFVGLPPSWSTSLAEAGFTEEEITAIHARRAMRSVAIPDNLKYLYNERPSSPSIGTGGANASGSGVQYANAQASSVPVLANPLPRSTSLHRLGRKKSGDALDGAKKAEDDADSGKPTLANIDTRAPASTSPLTPAQLSIPTPTSASASSVTRKPPPRRKPPLPVETEGETNNAVAFPSQASEAADASTERSGATNENYGQGNMARSRAESTTDTSRDDTTTSFSDFSNSYAYKYNPDNTINTTYSSPNTKFLNPAYVRQQTSESELETDTDDETSLSKAPLRFGSESSFAGTQVQNGDSASRSNQRFKVVNTASSDGHGDAERGEGANLNIEIVQRPAIAAADVVSPNKKGLQKKPSIWGSKINKSKSKESMAAAQAQGSAEGSSTSNWKATTSTSIAHASTSFAQASSSLVSAGSNLVDAVRSSAGRGVAKIKSRAGSGKEGINGFKRSKSKDGRSKTRGTAEGGDDEDLDGSDEEFASMPSPGQDIQPPMVWELYTKPQRSTDTPETSNNTDVSTEEKKLPPQPYTQRSNPTPLVPLRRQPSVRKASSSSTSLIEKTGATPSLSMSSLSNSLKKNQSTGSLRSLGKHKHSGSVTSLESIPEVSPPPVNDAGSYKRVKPALSSSFARAGDTSLASTDQTLDKDDPPEVNKAPALPPRLSLHQYADSSDLSSWSEALLSGISLGGDGKGKDGLGFGGGLNLDFGSFGTETQSGDPSSTWNNRDRFMEKEPLSAPATAATITAKSWATTSTSSQNPQPKLSATPPRTQIRKAGQPLPSSKPPPNLPIPPIVPNPSASSSSLPTETARVNANGHTRARSRSQSSVRPDLELGPSPVPPIVFSPPPPLPGHTSNLSLPATTPLSSRNKPLPSPIDDISRSTAGAPENLLSPPATAWSAKGMVSPPGSSAGPDSAQLWDEIEQMMDPGMMNSIPGLHLSVALPPGAQGVLRSAGVSPGSQRPLPPPLDLTVDTQSQSSPKTVGDLVGMSPSSPILTATPSTTLPFSRAPVPRYDETGKETGQSTVGNNLDRPNSQTQEDFRLSVVTERDTNRDSSRSSTSTLTAAVIASATVVRNVSVARRAGAYVIDKRRPGASQLSPIPSSSLNTAATFAEAQGDNQSSPSPLGSQFGGTGSEESGGSGGSFTSSSQDLEPQPTPTTTDGGMASPLLYYLGGVQTPSPTPDKVNFEQRYQMSSVPTFATTPLISDGDDDEESFAGYPDEETMEAAKAAGVISPARPTIIISDAPLSGGAAPMGTTVSNASSATPLSPFQRYRGWLSAVVAPLEEFIDESIDPRDHYMDLNEIAEGDSGSVFASVLNPETAHKLRLPPLVKAKDADEIMAGRTVLVAIKSVAIVPSGSPKLVDLQHELTLMRGLCHENVLGMDGVYVDLQEDSLWVRMELMERSLADIIQLVDYGLQLQERTIARFASDVLCALQFLQQHNIAHRDVRSDNLLLNKHGVLKLADFSNAVQVQAELPMRSDIVGVPFWQAPEVRKPPYDTLKVDVWSLGATVWEMAQKDPPFADTQQLADRWPPLDRPDLFSPAFHTFLEKCSEPAASRPSPSELLKSPLIVNKACGRQVIVLLLSQCMSIEKKLQEESASP